MGQSYKGAVTMPVRNGLLSTLRARGRTVLFTLLILVLTVALALGLGMWACCNSLLSQMEEQYTSVALVEYMGENYPDEDTADSGARTALETLDGRALSAVDGVELWEPARSTFVSIDGYKHPSGNSPYRNSAVVVATITPEFTIGRAPVSQENLSESRAVLVHSTPDGDSGGLNYTFILPGLESLELPYYYLKPDTGMYQRQGDSLDEESAEEPEGPYVLLHVVRENYYNWSIRYDVMGELPAEYDRGLLNALLMSNCHYEYYPDEDLYIGLNETVLDSANTHGRISEVLYSPYGTGSLVCYFNLTDAGFIPEEGTRYLLHGAFVFSDRVTPSFQVQPFPDSGDTPWLELSGEDDPALTQGIFVEYAERYRLSNNTAVLTASDDIASLELFHQGTLHLADGRFPQAGEAGVCIISGSMSENLGLSVGDTLELEVLDSMEWNRAYVSATGDRRPLEIVGVTNPQSDYANRLWVSAAEASFSSPPFGYLLGMAVLDNRQAVQAAQELSGLLPPQTRLTLYDQGYSAAAQPIQAMESAALAITLASAFGALAVLVLFALLFVGRQGETVGVLVSLGTPAGKIRAWLLSGAAAVSGTAALLGSAIGTLALGRVVAAAMDMAQRLYATDTRYSEAATGITKEAAAGALPGWPAPAAGAAVFLTALVLCLAFLRHAQRENAPKQGKVSVRVPRGHTTARGRGAPRFAVLSALRGGRRSAVVVAAALVLTLFVSLPAAGAQSWGSQMDSLYADSRLEGQVVSLNGRKQTDLVIPMRDIQVMWKSGYLEDISVSLGWHYVQTDEIHIPTYYDETYLLESESSTISRLPSLSVVGGLSAAAEFCYTDRPEIQWLEGWDESCLADDSYPSVLDGVYACVYGEQTQAPNDIYPILAGSRFLENSGLRLGDTLNVKLYIPLYVGNNPPIVQSGKLMMEWPVRLRVVGSFTSAGTKDNLYAPLSLWCGQEWLHGDGGAELATRESNRIEDLDSMKRWVYFSTRFQTCRFTLKSAYELENLRNWLAEQEYSQVGVINQNRITVLLWDESFVDAVGSLGRYISFSRILFPVLFLVVGLLGFIISWLMVSSRRMELAVMRGLGASPGHAFAAFFLEQAALCLAGCLAGVLAMALLYPGSAVWLAGAGFLACYLAGCALSVLTAGRTNLMRLLSERE